MAKQQPKVKVTTKVATIEDVQRSLQEVEKRLNELSLSINQVAESESTEGEGKSGDLKMVQNANKSFSLEGCTDEGWKRLYSGEGDNKVETFFYDKQANIIKPVPVVNKWDSMPAPDYDSGWFDIRTDRQYVTGATTGVVPDDSYVYVSGHVIGIPALGFILEDYPSKMQILYSSYKTTSFKQSFDGKTGALGTDAVVVLTADGAGQYYTSDKGMGSRVYMTNKEHICMSTAEQFTHYWSSGSVGGNSVRSDSADWTDVYDAGGGTDGNISARLKIWK